MGTLYERLKNYGESDHYGFHMPGHKRQTGIPGMEKLYQIDITEIEGFDDLHHPRGILKEAQERAARVFQAEETHFLINGSTVGILSALAGVTRRGDTVLVARNCHKSVYHAIYMKELKPVYLYPGFDQETGLNTQISPEDVRRALEADPTIRAVVIVSPTYEGIVSDVEKIGEEAHAKGIPLIVDEAHGAHFGFHPYFPGNSNTKGADLVVQSLHKTLPSLTQTALLHMNGSYVDRREVRRYLDMLQTSSPSYVLMASIDDCVCRLEEKGDELWEPYVERLKWLRGELEKLKALELIRLPGQEPSKLVISTALMDVDEMAGLMYNADKSCGEFQYPRLEQVYTSAGMADRRRDGVRGERVPWEESEGMVSFEYAYLYPPGIPLIVPGERINREAVEILRRYREMGFAIEGLDKEGWIEVWKDG